MSKNRKKYQEMVKNVEKLPKILKPYRKKLKKYETR